MSAARPLGLATPRAPDQIARRLHLRAEKAIAHFSRLAQGGRARTCPICGYRGRFSPVRHKPEIWCPGCDSRPRHRLLKLWFDREAEIAPTARVLHFAAEPWVRDLLHPRVGEYVTADITDAFDLTLDITAMDLADARFDLVIVNHVLEHVDDAAALSELYRVLSPGGLAVLTVPLVEGWDHSVELQDASDAERAFRLTDPTHLRMYGRDFRDRIRAAGFELTEYTAVEPDVGDYALHRGERIFLARKPGGAA